jgi:hypothetical protein
MWCTQCHTAFSWKHGTIEKSIHNPHYYEWLRRTSLNGEIPRNQGDNPCDHFNAADLPLKKDEVTRLCEMGGQVMDKYTGLIQSMIHIRQVELPFFNNRPNNEKLRVQYMMNEITERQFQILIQRSHKRNEKNQELRAILTAFLDSLNDILTTCRFLLNTPIQSTRQKKVHLVELKENFLKKLQEIEALVDYTNECFKDVSVTYGSILYTMTCNNSFPELRLTSHSHNGNKKEEE